MPTSSRPGQFWLCLLRRRRPPRRRRRQPRASSSSPFCTYSLYLHLITTTPTAPVCSSAARLFVCSPCIASAVTPPHVTHPRSTDSAAPLESGVNFDRELLSRANLGSVGAISGRLLLNKAKDAVKFAKLHIAAFKLHANATDDKPHGVLPSGTDMAAMCLKVIKEVNGGLAVIDLEAEDAEDAEGDGDAADVAGGEVEDDGSAGGGGGDERKTTGFMVWFVFGPHAPASDQSVLLSSSDLKGSRKQQRGKKKKETAQEKWNSREVTATEDQLRMRAEVELEDMRLKQKDDQQKSLILSQRVQATLQRMEMAAAIVGNKAWSEAKRATAETEYDRLAAEAARLDSEYQEILDAKAKRASLPAVGEYLSSKKAKSSAMSMSSSSSSSGSS